jgi:hypothetical protein
MNRLH